MFLNDVDTNQRFSMYAKQNEN